MNTDPKASLILIVDDEPHRVTMLQSILDEAGYSNVHVATESASTHDVVRRVQPDLLILHLGLPDNSGFDALEAIQRDLEEGDFLPVLVLTGDIRPEAKLRALAAGATDFLADPYDNLEIRLRVHSLLRTRLKFQHLAQRTALAESGARFPQQAGRLAEQLIHERRQRKQRSPIDIYPGRGPH